MDSTCPLQGVCDAHPLACRPAGSQLQVRVLPKPANDKAHRRFIRRHHGDLTHIKDGCLFQLPVKSQSAPLLVVPFKSFNRLTLLKTDKMQSKSYGTGIYLVELAIYQFDALMKHAHIWLNWLFISLVL